MSRLSRRLYLALVIVLAVIVPHAAWSGRGPTVFAIGPRAQLGWQAGATISATGGAVHDATFLDASSSWAVGSSGGLYLTTDGGSTWTTVVTGLTNDLDQLVSADAQNGYVRGTDIILQTTKLATAIRRTGARGSGLLEEQTLLGQEALRAQQGLAPALADLAGPLPASGAERCVSAALAPAGPFWVANRPHPVLGCLRALAHRRPCSSVVPLHL